jgi:hypothetical protein
MIESDVRDFPLVEGDRDMEARLVGVFQRVMAPLYPLNDETSALERTDHRFRLHCRQGGHTE